MNQEMQTEQEHFWKEQFGSQYISRNIDKSYLASNINLFSRIMRSTSGVQSLMEYGANVGMNLLALKNLSPNLDISAVEINENAYQELKQIEGINAECDSMLEYTPKKQHDFVLVKGVLIHINPDHLNTVYDLLYKSSEKYICLVEYYNPSPVMVPYRGHDNRLFKRDFAGDLLDRFKDLNLVDYGFCYRRDNNFKQDDVTWFLLEKKG